MKKDMTKNLPDHVVFYDRESDCVVFREQQNLYQEIFQKRDVKKCFKDTKPTLSPEIIPITDVNDNVQYDTHDFSEVCKSEVVTLKEMKNIAAEFPLKTYGKTLDLVYSSYNDGFSLQSLYRKCKSWSVKSSIIDNATPFVILISDTRGYTFGAVCSCLPRVTPKRYAGSGESMLFSIRPQFKVFPWTGLNNFFAAFNLKGVSIGGTVGKENPGLWFDSDLLHGRSTNCETYNNDILSSDEDFEICGIEVWSFTV